MRSVAIGVAGSLYLSVCLCVCLLVTTVSPAKRLNRSRCHLGHGMELGGCLDFLREGAVLREISESTERYRVRLARPILCRVGR